MLTKLFVYFLIWYFHLQNNEFVSVIALRSNSHNFENYLKLENSGRLMFTNDYDYKSVEVATNIQSSPPGYLILLKITSSFVSNDRTFFLFKMSVHVTILWTLSSQWTRLVCRRLTLTLMFSALKNQVGQKKCWS